YHVILAIWPDGRVVWSEDRLRGGPPYFEGRVQPKRVNALLSQFEADGLFAGEDLNYGRFGPHTQFTPVLPSPGKKQVRMKSWHELAEATGKVVGTSHVLVPLDGRRRLEVLRKEPAEYLYFQVAWSETRRRLAELIPREGKPTAGRPVLKAGVMSWQDEPAKAEPTGPSNPGNREPGADRAAEPFCSVKKGPPTTGRVVRTNPSSWNRPFPRS